VVAVYVLEGARIRSLDDFWSVWLEALGGDGRRFGRNLDAFNDALSGGPGTPETGDDDDDWTYLVEWREHELSRASLGYPETVCQLERRLTTCHPLNRPHVQADLDAARAGHGPTDWLVAIFEDHIPGRLRLC
jgi:hypothetical protein